MPSMLYITCPKTQKEVATGIITEERTARTVGKSARMRCPECGDEHQWKPDEARPGPLQAGGR